VALLLIGIQIDDSIPAPEPKPLDPPNLSQSRVFVEKSLALDTAAVVAETIPVAGKHQDAEHVSLQGQKIATLLAPELNPHRWFHVWQSHGI
jgi:hypothetical protein